MDSTNSRTWLGIIVGVVWGLFLGSFFKSEDMTGPWLLVLFGPPVVLLVSPKTPVLSWQTPIVTATLYGSILARSRGDTGSGGAPDTMGSVLLMSLLIWLMVSVFSCPWPFIFQRRSQKEVQAGAPKNEEATASRVGAVLIVFVVCGVVLLGFAATVYPVESNENGQYPGLYGLFIIAVGVVLSVGAYRFADRLGIGDRVKEVLELPLILGGVFGVLFVLVPLILMLWEKQPQRFSTEEIFSLLAALEAAAGLLWLHKLKQNS